jgi:hypothetical protein
MKLSIRTLLLTAAVVCLVPTSALAAAQPSVTTGGASALAPDSATVAGSVNPNGLVTTWYFQYGKTKSYGSRTTAQDAGSGSKRVRVTSTLTGLANKTTYHYRLVATNSRGTTVGADKTFKTPEAPTISTIAATPNPAVFGQTVQVSGFLAGPRGGGGKQVALEAQAFPFTGGFQQVGNTVVTAADGSYSFVFTAILGVQLHVVDRSDSSIVSPTWTEAVAIRPSLKHKRGSSGRVRFSGHLTPAGQTSAVVLQRRTHKGGWKNIKAILPRKGSSADRFSKRVRARRGLYRVVARPASGGYVEGVSRRVRVRH